MVTKSYLPYYLCFSQTNFTKKLEKERKKFCLKTILCKKKFTSTTKIFKKDYCHKNKKKNLAKKYLIIPFVFFYHKKIHKKNLVKKKNLFSQFLLPIKMYFKLWQLKNSNCYNSKILFVTTQKLKWRQIKNLNCDKSKTQTKRMKTKKNLIVTKPKLWENSWTHVLTKLKHSSCEKLKNL